jgi:hypothetical protein
MIDGIVGNKQLPANIRQDIIERTGGNDHAHARSGEPKPAERTAAIPLTQMFRRIRSADEWT